MLARLPLPCLLLMAALSTLFLCFALYGWSKERKLAARACVVSVGCCLGMVAVGAVQYQDWTAGQMLVGYSFAWTGLTIGLFPSRKLIREYAEERRHGAEKVKFEYPKQHWRFLFGAVTVMILLAFVLSS
ncbi:hypothetical protein [Streptomyces sp. YIM S03343]